MTSYLDEASRRRRIDELKAEREKMETEMGKVQSRGALSERRDRLVQIDEEIKRLSEGETS